MTTEKMEESSTALNGQTNRKSWALAILLVLGSIEGNEEPNATRKRKTEDRANVRQRESNSKKFLINKMLKI